jgi:hypothetical protein
MVVSDKRDSRADRQLLEGEIMTPRDRYDVSGPFAIYLAFARWIGGILERVRSRKRDG